MSEEYTKEELKRIGDEVRRLKQENFCMQCQNDGLMMARNIKDSRIYGFKCSCKVGLTIVSKGMAQWEENKFGIFIPVKTN